MKSLVTGASGFIAKHLIRRLLADGTQTVAWSRGSAPKELRHESLAWQTIDLLDAGQVNDAMESAKPDHVFHLSAQCLPKVSWEDPTGTFDANVIGTIHLLNALQRHAPKARLILASSSALYAPHPDHQPIREDHPLEGASLYAISKMAQEMTARMWGRKYNMPVVTVRPFFVIGPEKRGDVCADLAQRVVYAERSEEPVIRVGNLAAVRDFVDITDAVQAFRVIAEKGEPDGVYNLARGSGWSVGDVLEYYRISAMNPLEIKVDPALLRPVDEPVKIGDPSKLRALGWEPAVPVEMALAKILDYWRTQDQADG